MRISVCIPHFNRCKYLLNCLESVARQTYPDLEVVVTDNASTDDTAEVIPGWLERSKLRHRYLRHEKNLGFDRNWRAAMAAATGDYLFILGNDDALAEPDTLSNVAKALEQLGSPDVVVANYRPFNQATMRRARRTTLVGAGPEVALRMFRIFSSVTGLILKADAVRAHVTDRYDGTVYSQIFLASRVIAAGGSLATIDECVAIEGVLLEGRHANSYRDWVFPQLKWKLNPHTGGLERVGRLACEAISPYLPPGKRNWLATRTFGQLLAYSYAYWLYDYRKHGGLWPALNLSLGCFPLNLTRGVACSAADLAALLVLYGAVTGASFAIPIPILGRLKGMVQATSRR